MGFRDWLFEVGSSGGVGGGMSPERYDPSLFATALQDYHGEESRNPKDDSRVLPPSKKPFKKVYKSNGRKESGAGNIRNSSRLG